MKLVTYLKNRKEQLAFLANGMLFDCNIMDKELPVTMNAFLKHWDDFYPLAKKVNDELTGTNILKSAFRLMDDVKVLAPVPHPSSCRDAYAFRQHVAVARRNRGLPMIPQFDEYPVFYFTNHHSIQGPGLIECMPDHLEKLDFELEAAIVICKEGKNIPAEEADNYIAGLMIMNDMSARVLQMEEMLLNLGPAKGKDFSTVIGPYLVTLDELEKYEVPCKQNHTGKSWNLSMRCKVNGKKVSEGNLSDMDWTFAEIIERCSYGTSLYPSDIIGSGTVGTGCFLELNGTGKMNDPDYIEQWLLPGDSIEMEIEGLGKLVNTVYEESTTYSILSKKKQTIKIE